MTLTDETEEAKEEARMEELIRLALRSENFSFKWRSRPMTLVEESMGAELTDAEFGNEMTKAPQKKQVLSYSVRA